jgi:hypothetical protein
MTSAKELAGSLDLHKSIVGAKSIHIRAADGVLRLASGSASGKTLITRIKSTSIVTPICVDVSVLSAFFRGNGDVELLVKEDRLVCRSGRLNGEAPGLAEDSPRIDKAKGVTVSAADADWLGVIVPKITLTNLRGDGFFAIECDGQEWKLSCTDDICGACAYGVGSSKVRLALAPEDAEVFSKIISSTDKDMEFGFSEGRLMVSYPGFVAALPTVEGVAHPKSGAIEGVKKIARISGADLTQTVKAVEHFAKAKDAAPVKMIFSDSICLKATSSAGSLNQKIAGEVLMPTSVNLSYQLLAMLVGKIGNEPVSIQGLFQGKDVTRLTFKTKNAYYLMLTDA